MPSSTLSATALPYRAYSRIRNLGDSINPDILASVSGAVPYMSAPEVPHVLGIGSIFSMANRNSYVWGSGVHVPGTELPDFDATRVRALRGKLSLQALRASGQPVADIPLGDPGCLVARLLAEDPPPVQTGKVAVVPHHGSINLHAFQAMRQDEEIEFVDMMDDTLRPLHQIAGARVVLSQSLHGLVFAQALGKPFVWISRRFDEGWQFKFRDWSSTLHGPEIAPVGLDVPVAEMVLRAEPRDSAVDEAALIAALPVGEIGHAVSAALIDHRTCRRAGPAVVWCPAETLSALAKAWRVGRAETVLRTLSATHFSGWAVRVYTVFTAGMPISSAELAVMTRYMDENPGTAFAAIVRGGTEPQAGEPLDSGLRVRPDVAGPLKAVLVRPTLVMRRSANCVTFVLPDRSAGGAAAVSVRTPTVSGEAAIPAEVERRSKGRGVMRITPIRRHEGWLERHLPGPEFSPPALAEAALIEARAKQTDDTGSHPLWEGYGKSGEAPASRRPDKVRTRDRYGLIYAWLASAFGARTIVEFGTAFGVSGMFWLAGLKATGGQLFTFEPNTVWAGFARENLGAISDRFTLTEGTFEENAARVLGERRIDIAFIDAIHTSAFVNEQFRIVRRHARPGALVLFDDIGFSDDMRACWETIAQRGEGIAASVTIGTRVGIVELEG